MSQIEGTFIGRRIKTEYNTNTNLVVDYIVDIKYNIKQISEFQVLVSQYNLSNGNIYELLFFKNETGFFSSSQTGIDNIFLNKDNELIHQWSIPIDSNGVLTNAHAILNRV